MFEVNTAVLLVVSLIGLVAIGVHIAIALGITSALGIFLVTGADAHAGSGPGRAGGRHGHRYR